MEFSSETGAVLPCSARGQPAPRITWEKKDGSPASAVSTNQFAPFSCVCMCVRACVFNLVAFCGQPLKAYLKKRLVPGLRSTRSDGSLVLSSFSSSQYRQDVHSATYRCVASNSIGVVKSRLVHVQGGELPEVS
ncbi:unnamed protein product [Ixodes persulcatus]